VDQLRTGRATTTTAGAGLTVTHTMRDAAPISPARHSVREDHRRAGARPCSDPGGLAHASCLRESGLPTDSEVGYEVEDQTRTPCHASPKNSAAAGVERCGVNVVAPFDIWWRRGLPAECASPPPWSW